VLEFGSRLIVVQLGQIVGGCDLIPGVVSYRKTAAKPIIITVSQATRSNGARKFTSARSLLAICGTNSHEQVIAGFRQCEPMYPSISPTCPIYHFWVIYNQLFMTQFRHHVSNHIDRKLPVGKPID